jgi:hypothetical protein
MRNYHVALTCSLFLTCELIGFAHHAGSGNLYRCERNGEALYSDQACGPEAVTINPAPLASAASRTPITSTTRHKGEPLETIRQQQAMSCLANEYNSWYRQQRTKPSEAGRKAMIDSIDARCRAMYPSTLPAKPPPETGSKEALFEGVLAGQISVVKQYLDGGGDPNLRKSYLDVGRRQASSPLVLMAVASHHEEMVHLLIERGARADDGNEMGYTTLHAAANNGMIAVLEFLVARGAKVTTQTIQGYTPLHSAVHGRKPESIRFLLEHGASLDAIDKFHGTPLHNAVVSNKRNQALPLVTALLNAGARPNQRNVRGETVLHLAINSSLSPTPELVQLLIDSGADLEATNIRGETPHALALRFRHRETVALLDAQKKS